MLRAQRCKFDIKRFGDKAYFTEPYIKRKINE